MREKHAQYWPGKPPLYQSQPDLLRKRERKKETSFRCDAGDDLRSRSRSSTREIQGLVIERSVPSVSRRTDLSLWDGRTDRQLTHPAADRRPPLTNPRSGWPDAVAWKPSLPDAPWRRASALHLALHSTRRAGGPQRTCGAFLIAARLLPGRGASEPLRLRRHSGQSRASPHFGKLSAVNPSSISLSLSVWGVWIHRFP